MNRLVIFRSYRQSYLCGRKLIGFCALLFCVSMATSAQNSAAPASAPVSVKATHLLGFENTKHNGNGNLSVKDGQLLFEEEGKPTAEIKVGSIQSIALNEEEKQVGGVPMSLGKAATPFGGGRVISAFAHKDFDFLTLEYVDSDGGLHGAIFQLEKGQGEVVRKELVAAGSASVIGKIQPAKPAAVEGTHENK